MHVRLLDQDRDAPTLLGWFQREPSLERAITAVRIDFSKPVESFVIERDGRLVGGIDLYNVSADAAKAEIGLYVLDPADRRRGVGMMAARRLLRYAFGETPLRLVLARVGKDNDDMTALMPRIGFERVGWKISKETFLRKWGE